MKNNQCSCQHCQNQSESGGFMAGLIVGMMIGASLAYIYSSPDGKKKAKMLIDEGIELMKDMGEKKSEFAQKIDNVKKSLSDQIREAAGENISSSKNQSVTYKFRQRFFKKNGKQLKN